MIDWTDQARAAEDLTPRLEVDGPARVFLEFATGRPSVGIDFPWWDRSNDLLGFAEWLRGEAAVDFCDADQGWTFDAARRGERLYFRQGDLDTGETFIALSVDRKTFQARFETALAACSFSEAEPPC